MQSTPHAPPLDHARALITPVQEAIREELKSTDMLFVTAGMGGGTGTGAAPVIAKAAKEKGVRGPRAPAWFRANLVANMRGCSAPHTLVMDRTESHSAGSNVLGSLPPQILTVGIVTKPFHSEGSMRMQRAEAGIKALQESVDTLIVINNQNLLSSESFSKRPLPEPFQLVNNIIYDGIKSVTYPIVKVRHSAPTDLAPCTLLVHPSHPAPQPGLVNIDFADVDTIMRGAGRGVMGTGEAKGDERARVAATQVRLTHVLPILGGLRAHGSALSGVHLRS